MPAANAASTTFAVPSTLTHRIRAIVLRSLAMTPYRACGMIYAVYATHCFLQRLWISHIANSMLNRPCLITQQIKLELGSPENAHV